MSARSALYYAVASILVCGPAIASLPQADAARAPFSGTQLLFLGTGGGPGLDQNHSEPSTLLIVDNRRYLIDCGIGTMRRLLDAGVPSETIHTIFFTHLHADHDLGLADVMANDFFMQNQAGSHETIDIYGPPQTAQLVDAGFHYLTFGFTAFAEEPGAIRAGLVNGALSSPFKAHEIQHDGVVFQDDKIRVTASENSHYGLMPSPAREKLRSYSYRVETARGAIVFTGDTGKSDAVRRLAEGADVLVSEIQSEKGLKEFVNRLGAENHWSSDRTAALMEHMMREHLVEKDAGELAANAHVRSLVLDHYDSANAAAYIAEVKKYYGGPVFGSSDLARYCVAGQGAPAAGPLTACGSR